MVTAWTGCCIMTMHHLTPFSPGNFFTKNNMIVVLHPPYFSVSPIEDKTERAPFWHNWGNPRRITGSAEHPNTISSMHLKNGRSAGKGAQAWKGTISRVIVARRPKVSFWPDGSTSPGNYGWLFVILTCYRLLSVKYWWPNGVCISSKRFWTNI
jgi:hypothetical protein